MPTIVINCPTCPNVKQTAIVPEARLKEKLQIGEEIFATGSVCGHTWKLSVKDLEILRAAVAKGDLR